jgi:hypothetical protein
MLDAFHVVRRALLAAALTFCAAASLIAPRLAAAAEKSRATTTTATTAKSPAACRPQDRLWVINSCKVDCPKSGETPPLSYQHRDANGTWQAVEHAEFVKAIGAGQARFWVHGYKVDDGQAASLGEQAHNVLVEENEPPLNFCIWAWPAERDGLQLPDIRRKACRTNTEAYALGWLLAQLDGRAEVSLVGYSFGARVVTGGLHVAGGGEICGVQLAEPLRNVKRERPMRAVLLAPAFDNTWLSEGAFHGMALAPTESMLSIYSSRDRVLRWYHVAAKDRSAVALGYAGIATLPPRDGDEGKFGQFDASGVVGTSHALQGYLTNFTVTAVARETLQHSQHAAAKQNESVAK